MIQPDLQCSWFPELWIHNCCLAHDLGASDDAFFQCVKLESYPILGVFSYLFAALILAGMVTFRPIRVSILNLMEKIKEAIGRQN